MRKSNATSNSGNGQCGWQATAAYLYTLTLDRPQLAWEYLRRNEVYWQTWQQARRGSGGDTAMRWGLARPGGSWLGRAPGTAALDPAGPRGPEPRARSG